MNDFMTALPCPFCGSEASVSCYPTLALIECSPCKLRGVESRAYGHGPESTQQTIGGISWTTIFNVWNYRAESQV